MATGSTTIDFGSHPGLNESSNRSRPSRTLRGGRCGLEVHP